MKIQSTVEDVLTQERKNTNFNITKMSQFIYGAQEFHQMQKVFHSLPQIPSDFNLFNQSRVQLIKNSYRKLPLVINNISIANQYGMTYLFLALDHQMPGSAHLGMFTQCIAMMGTDEQVKQYIQKCLRYQIVGCYAQTQLGHGSDVKGLETTATWVQGRNQLIINTPTISAAKYWPGDLGISANYALIFAQLIIKGNKLGIQPFIVKIRDQNGNPMPGIQVGDIGPKIGFHTKDNGYLILNNVVIPKDNLLRRFIDISPQGQIKVLGDPTIMYATMMIIRQYISCRYPKIYAQAITIGLKYSLFRSQFKNSQKTQIKIINYQTQQEKIIPRIAEFYAITVTGNVVKKLCSQNLQQITNNQDSSLMAEAHSCLSVTKTFFSETVLDGMEIIRKACGGHGYSHYSGLPSLIFEYKANVTHQGENTVLYLQTARYIIKSYKHFVRTNESLPKSLQYIQSYDYLMNKHIEQYIDATNWKIEDIRILLAQTVFYLIKCVMTKLTSSPQTPESQLWNSIAGIRLRQLAFAHGCYYTFSNFMVGILKEKNQQLRDILNNLLAVYGINLILSNTGPIIEGGFIKPGNLSSIKNFQELLFKKLRPYLIGLVDAFGLPEKLIRSDLTHGNPYENMINSARNNKLNNSIPQSGLYVRRNIQKALFKPKL